MRWIIKIILFPFNILLGILISVLTFLLGIGATILNIVSLLCIFGSIAAFLQKDVLTGIQGLVIAFLLSEYGLPLLGVKIIAYMKLAQYKIKEI